MKRFLNISLVFPVFILLFAVLGCEKERTYRDTSLAKPEFSEGYFMPQVHRPVIAVPANAVPVVAEKPAFMAEYPAAKIPSAGKPTQPAPREPGQIEISRIYPTTEFAILQMNKIVPEEVELNKPFDYSIRVKNLTDTTLTNIMVNEELPPNFKHVSSEPPAKENAANLVWKIESLAPRESRQITVTGKATDADSLRMSTTVVTNFVPAAADIKVVQPKLELAVTVPEGAILCDTIPVQFTVTNSGTGSARDVKIVHTLPTGLHFIDGRSEIELDAGTLTAGQTRKFAAKFQAVKNGKYVSKTVATATGLKAESKENMLVVGQPVLVINKTGTERQYAGKPVTYTITVANKGDAPAKDAVVEDTIPPGVASIKATAGALLTPSRTVVWKLGVLAPDETKSLRVSYVPNQVGTIMDKTTATAYCAEAVTASAETTVAGIAGVMLEVIDIEDPVEIGTSTTYTITVTNQGSAPATGIDVTCFLEESVRYISSTGATSGLLEGNMLKFAILDSLAPKTKAVWRVVVQALEPTDSLFKVIMNTEQLSRPVQETEATHLYK